MSKHSLAIQGIHSEALESLEQLGQRIRVLKTPIERLNWVNQQPVLE